MPIITPQRPQMGICDQCKAERIRVVSWSIAQQMAMGYQGVGSVHLCAGCLASRREELLAAEPFVEELRATLRERGIPYVESDKRERLLDMVGRLAPEPTPSEPPEPDGEGTASTVPAAPAGGWTVDALTALSRAEIVAVALAEPYGFESVPERLSKAQIAERIIDVQREDARIAAAP